MSADESRELTPIPVQGGMQPYNPVGAIGRFWANWQPQNREDKSRIFRAFNEVGTPADMALNKPFRLTHVLVHPVDIADPVTGEVTACHRAVLFAADGGLYSFVSVGILKSLSLLCMMEGQGPWTPGLPVSIRQLGLKGGRRTFTIDLLPEDAVPLPTKEVTRGRK